MTGSPGRSLRRPPHLRLLKGARVAKNQSPEVQMERRAKSDRREGDRRKENKAVAVERRVGERRAKVARRRQIDPTTCERDYNNDEIEFMQAMDAYKRANGRMFPTCSEILEVIRSLGYVRMPSQTTTAPAATEKSTQSLTDTTMM